jgi:hypothetical protein
MGTGVQINGEPLGWPQDFGQQNNLSLPELANRFEKPVMVASDKISFVAGELYSLRRQAPFFDPRNSSFWLRLGQSNPRQVTYVDQGAAHCAYGASTTLAFCR